MLASAYGLQYDLPQDSMSDRPVRGGLGGVPEMPQMNFGQDDLASSGDLFVKEGVTDEYYKKVAALKSFANEVSSRYGYDVTRPNYRDPESIKYHKAYLESLADLQRQQNELKRLGQQENLSIQSPNIKMSQDESGNSFAMNVGENDLVKRLSETAKAINNESDAEIFNSEVKPRLLEQLMAEASSTQDPRERAELENSIRIIENISPSVGISPSAAAQYDLQERQLAETGRHNRVMEGISSQRASGSGGRSLSQGELDAQDRLISISKIASSPDQLRSYGLERVDMASGTFFKKVGEENPDKWVKIDPKRPDAWMMGLNGLINNHEGFGNVSFDKVSRMLGDNMDIFSNEFVKGVNASEDLTDVMSTALESLPAMIKTDPSIGKKIVSMMETGNKIPKDVANAFGTTIGEKGITNVKFGTSAMGNSYLEMRVPNKNGSGTVAKKLMFNEQEDLKIIRSILKHNADRIPRELINDLIPQTPSGGTNVVQEEFNSLYDEF